MNDSATHPLFLPCSSLLFDLYISLGCCSSRTWCNRRVAILALSFLSYSNDYGTSAVSLALLQPIMRPRNPSRIPFCLGVSVLIRHFVNIVYVQISCVWHPSGICVPHSAYILGDSTNLNAFDGWVNKDYRSRWQIVESSSWLVRWRVCRRGPEMNRVRNVEPLLIFLALLPASAIPHLSTFSAANIPWWLIRGRQAVFSYRIPQPNNPLVSRSFENHLLSSRS